MWQHVYYVMVSVGGGGKGLCTLCTAVRRNIWNWKCKFSFRIKINPCVFHSMSGFGPESVSVRSTDWRYWGIHAPGAPVTWEVPCCLLVFVRRKCIITAAVKMFLTTKDKSCFRANMIKTLQCPSKNKNKSPSSKS